MHYRKVKMEEKDKLKLKELLDNIKITPEGKSDEEELDNLYSFVLELKELHRKYYHNSKEEYETFDDTFMLLCDEELRNRIFKIMSMVDMKIPIRESKIETIKHIL